MKVIIACIAAASALSAAQKEFLQGQFSGESAVFSLHSVALAKLANGDRDVSAVESNYKFGSSSYFAGIECRFTGGGIKGSSMRTGCCGPAGDDGPCKYFTFGLPCARRRLLDDND